MIHGACAKCPIWLGSDASFSSIVHSVIEEVNTTESGLIGCQAFKSRTTDLFIVNAYSFRAAA